MQVRSQKVEEEHIKVVFVPAGCTGMLRPLDVSINDGFKRHLKEKFEEWYAEEIAASLGDSEAVISVKVDLRTSVIEPLHFKWLVSALSWMKESGEMV